MINIKEKVSEATEEGKRLKLRLHCARVEADKTYKITLGWTQTCLIANIQAQLCVLWYDFSCKHWLCYIILVSGLLAQLNKPENINPRVLVSNPMWDWLYVLNIFCIWLDMIYRYIVNIYHMTLHPMQHCLIHNSKFQGFTTAQQNWPNITHLNLPLLL